MNITLCRNTVSFAAPLRAADPRTVRTHSVCRLPRGCPDVADCPLERSCSPSGCPSPSLKSRLRKSSFRQERLAQTFLERSIAGAHRCHPCTKSSLACLCLGHGCPAKTTRHTRRGSGERLIRVLCSSGVPVTEKVLWDETYVPRVATAAERKETLEG